MDRRALTDEQRHAVETTEVNYPLIAGAGTGKTTTLSFRYVELLAQNPELSPREILVTTFTKRAARDLVDAVQERILDRIAAADPVDAVDIERWQTVLDELDDAYVHTLHAFCQRILQEHAIDAPGIQYGFEVMDDVDATELQLDIIDSLLEERPAAIETLLESNLTSEQGLVNILQGLFQNRPHSRDWARYWSDEKRSVDEYLTHVETRFHPLDDDVATDILASESLRDAVDALREYVADPPLSSPGQATDRIRDVVETIDAAGGLDGATTPAERRQLIAAMSEILTTGSGGTYSGYTPKKTGWEASDSAREAIGDRVDTLVDTLRAEHWQDVLGDTTLDADRTSAPLVFALADVFSTAASRYQAAKRDRNILDYTDLVQSTRGLLTRDGASESNAEAGSSVRSQLQSQFEYVMIDEVQDTDPNQWAIVGELTTLGADASQYGRENVFVVGDEKQSIYRFRGADVAVFEATRTELVTANSTELAAVVDDELAVRVRSGDRPGFELARNFRTLPGVLEFINGVFDGVFEPDTDNRPAFEAPPQPLSPARDNPAGVDPVVEYLLVPDEDLAPDLLPGDHSIRDLPGYERRASEAHAVAARITRLLDDETPIYPEDGAASVSAEDDTAESDADGTRPVQTDDIAIILRKRTHLQAFKHALESASLPYTVVQGDGFFETPEVQTLLNLLRALADPADEIALYGVLRSPMFGLTDDTLAPYADSEELWPALQTATEPEVSAAVDILAAARSRGGCDGSTPEIDDWRTLTEWVLEQTGYRASVTADERPRQAVANIDKFIDRVGTHADQPRLQGVVERLEAEREHATYSPEAAIPSGSAGVKLMTVHAAKGDEFPVVIVPGITDSFNTQSPINNSIEFEVIDGTPELGIKTPDPENPFDTIDTIARSGLKDARLDRLQAEEKRILYVATTRARDHLILAGTHGGTVDNGHLDLDDATPDDPGSWNDFLQPLLLDDHTRALGGDTTIIDAELPGTQQPAAATSPATYRIRLPPTPVGRDDDIDDAVSLPPAIETPARPAWTYQLSPSHLSDLESEHPDGELAYDSDSNVVHYQRPPDDHTSTADDDTATDGTHDSAGPTSNERSLYGTVFGEAVHRICELTPPRSEWESVIDDTLIAMDSDHTLTDADRAAVNEHAQRAIDFVDAQRTPNSRRYDELELTAALPGGELYGFIDCLLVDDDTYHVIDYKTGDHTPDALAAKTAHYQPQLDAYAAMLTATSHVDDVKTTLYYTALDEHHTTTYDGGLDPATFEDRLTDLFEATDLSANPQ